MKRKICVVTSSRADYGLLYWLLKGIFYDDNFELQLLVTGMHLSPEFGLTYQEIEKEFPISKKIEILLSSDTSISISKSMGLAQISFSEAFNELNPDIVILLGDRYEILPIASAAMISNIPIGHIHGGEITQGAHDDSIRHAVTKMSHLHFVATEVYRKRVIQLGESPDMVFNVGGLGIENIAKTPLLSKEKFENSIEFKLNKRNILVTFHPSTLGDYNQKEQFEEILKSIDKLKDTNIIFTKANSDVNGRIINSMIDDYVGKNNKKSISFKSMGQLRYLSAMKYVDAVVGNSSSGLLEAPSFCIGTINIGDRQKGRVKASSVIDCEPIEKDIDAAFNILYSNNFTQKLDKTINPYGNGNASEKIIKVLKMVGLNNILKKTFYDK